MSDVKRFEELIAWQKARTLTKAVYAATLAGDFSRDFGLRDQIRRAAVSIMSNIAEGFERNSAAALLGSSRSRNHPVQRCAASYTLHWM